MGIFGVMGRALGPIGGVGRAALSPSNGQGGGVWSGVFPQQFPQQPQGQMGGWASQMFAQQFPQQPQPSPWDAGSFPPQTDGAPPTLGLAPGGWQQTDPHRYDNIDWSQQGQLQEQQPPMGQGFNQQPPVQAPMLTKPLNKSDLVSKSPYPYSDLAQPMFTQGYSSMLPNGMTLGQMAQRYAKSGYAHASGRGSTF